MSSSGYTTTVASIMLAALLLFLCGCGNKATGSATTTYAYILQNEYTGTSSSVAQFQMSETGTLTALNPPELTLSGFGLSLALDSSGRYLFVDSGSGMNQPATIQQFLVGSDGTLTPNAKPTIDAGTGSTSLTFVPNCKCAIAVNSVGLTSYSLSSSGSLTPVSSVPAGDQPFLLAVHPNGRFAFVAAYRYLGGLPTLVSEFSIAKDGTLTPMVSFVMENFPVAMVMSPKGFLYYIEDYVNPQPIVVCSVSPDTGGVSIVGNISTGTTIPFWIAFDPTGRYAYLVNSASAALSQFKVDSTTGALTANGPDIPIGTLGPTAAVDPSGRYLLVTTSTGYPESEVSVFTIGSDGTLSSTGSATLRSDASPVAIGFAQR